MSGRPKLGKGRALLLAAAGVLALFAAEPAFAQPAPEFRLAEPDPFSALVGKRQRADKIRNVERYAVAADDREFVVETRAGEARIKFLCHEGDPRLDCAIDPDGPAEEIFVLTTTRGPRGDLIFKTQDGDTLLKVTAYGGATVFWPGERMGQAASKSFGDDGSLELEPAGRGVAHRRAQAAAAHLSALTGSPILFDIGSREALVASNVAANTTFDQRQSFAAPAASAAYAPEAAGAAVEMQGGRTDATVLADAIARVAGGMHKVANDPTGARVMGARIKVVRFIKGMTPALELESTTFEVMYNPQGGLAGRPSSAAVERFLEESL
jgi:hypothetical protein